MFYLIQFHWVWLLLTVLLGIAIGWTTCTRHNDDRYRSWISTAAVAFVVALILALLRFLPGRVGYWLDMALLMFAFYIIGCCIGCWLKGRLDPDPAAVTPIPANTGSGLADVRRQTATKVSPSAAPTQISGVKPAALAAPIHGAGDDLKLIRGVGPTNESALNRLGIFHFSQVAKWNPDEVMWVSHSLAFPGRIDRERWVDQAQILSRGKDTVYSRQVKSGAVKPDDGPLGDAAVAALRADLAMAPDAPREGSQAASISAPGTAGTDSGSTSVPPATGSVAPATTLASVQNSTVVAAGSTGQDAAPAVPALRAQTDWVKPERVDPADLGAAEAAHPGSRPARLATPIGGTKDDLKLIKGIGPKNATVLNDLGVFHFGQIADWKPEEACWIGHHLAFPGRIEREHWIEQARILAQGGDTDHSQAVKSGLANPDDAPLSDADLNDLKAKLAPPPGPERPAIPAAAAGEAASVRPSPSTAHQTTEHPGVRPVGLAAPTGGMKDDLKMIKGIGPGNEMVLNDLGVFHFGQIADWKPAEALWVGHHMAFPGRIEREHWIEQAKLLSAGVDTEHAKAVRAGEVVPDDGALSAEETSKLKSDLPKQIASVASEDNHQGRRPLRLAEPRGGAPDDLKRIKGIGPQNEGRLHALGIWHFDQIAAWSADNIRWVGSHMAFPGRIDREKWIAQARFLATGANVSKGIERAESTPSKE